MEFIHQKFCLLISVTFLSHFNLFRHHGYVKSSRLHELTVIGETFISLRDKEFVGPDKLLEDKLIERMAASDKQFLAIATQPSLSSPRVHYSAYNITTGRFNYTRKNTPKLQVLYLMKFIIYSIQNRMEDLEPIVLKYSNDDRLRIGHIFCKLDFWQTQMITLFATVERKHRVTEHIMSYQHILATNIDITYTIEFLIHIQNAIGRTEVIKIEDEKPDYSKMSQDPKVQDEIAKYKGKNITDKDIKEIKEKLKAKGMYYDE